MAEQNKKNCKNRASDKDGEVSKSDVIKVLKGIAFSEMDQESLTNRERIKALDMLMHILGYDKQSDDGTEALDSVLDQIGGEI